MKIRDFDLSESVLVIAEIGNNHEGDPELAVDLVRAASKAGAAAVKFQTFVPELYVRRSDRERFSMLSRFRLSNDDFIRLEAVAREEGLLFLSTALDLASASFLTPLVDAFKVASGDLTFSPLLESVGRSGKPILLSTGAAEIEEIETAIGDLSYKDRLILMHCTSSYPAPDEDANLAALTTLRERFAVSVGFSDHTIGNEAAVAAVTLGARVIEKHFTLDHHHSQFRDHALSAEPDQFRELVERIAATVVRIGDGVKRVMSSERENRVIIRRSIAAARDLPAGSVLLADDLTWVRPGTGLPPGEENRLVGRTLSRDLAQGEHVTISDVDGADG